VRDSIQRVVCGSIVEKLLYVIDDCFSYSKDINRIGIGAIAIEMEELFGSWRDELR
jgi:hypothetical protein